MKTMNWLLGGTLVFAIAYLSIVGYAALQGIDKDIIVIIRPDNCDPALCEAIGASAASFAKDIGYGYRIVSYSTESIDYPGVFILGKTYMSRIEAVNNQIMLQQFL